MCLVSADKSRVRGEPCDLKFLGAETVHFGPTQEFGLEVGASDPDAVIEEIIQKRESLEQVVFLSQLTPRLPEATWAHSSTR
jgi:hypothetical protein